MSVCTLHSAGLDPELAGQGRAAGSLCLDSPSLCFSANATFPSLSILMLAREEGGKKESNVGGEKVKKRIGWPGSARMGANPRTKDGDAAVAVAEQGREAET